jgi:hypothetical protein
MKTYTYSQARQGLAGLLDRAGREGRVLIRRRDGRLFALTPAAPGGSPLDVPAARARSARGESLAWLRAARRAERRARESK